jgi:hypothetical protein
MIYKTNKMNNKQQTYILIGLGAAALYYFIVIKGKQTKVTVTTLPPEPPITIAPPVEEEPIAVVQDGPKYYLTGAPTFFTNEPQKLNY